MGYVYFLTEMATEPFLDIAPYFLHTMYSSRPVIPKLFCS